MNELRGYDYYFQFTITGYGKSLEPNVAALNQRLDIFKTLSDKIGKKRVIWRYDPIIFSNDFDVQYHVKMFKYIAQELEGKTQRCVISFVDFYKKILKNMSSVGPANFDNAYLFEVANALSNVSSRHNIELTSCAEEVDLAKYGISHGKCIDDKLIEEIFNIRLDIAKDKTQREECGCVASIDIGAYNTCPNGCLYCYANYDMNKVRHNYSLHDPESPLLFGDIGANDKITERKLKSCKVYQRGLFS